MTNAPATYPVAEIVKQVNGVLIGAPQQEVQGVCALDDPRPGCIAFSTVREANALLTKIKDSPLAALLIDDSVDADALSQTPIPLIQVANPQRALISIVPTFHPNPKLTPGISPQAVVADSATIGDGVSISPFAVIGENVVIEDNVQIHPHVVIYAGARIGARSILHAGAIIREYCVLGSDCTIQNGAVIGADGFGYIPNAAGGLSPVPQVGVVDLAAHVDVGANACIDRATLGATRVGVMSKIDNLVQVGHNVQIGNGTVLCGQAGIGGSTKIGNQCVIGGQCGVADHIEVADKVRTGGHSAIDRTLTESGDYNGFPIMPAMAWNRIRARVWAWPEALQAIKRKKK